MAQTLSQADSVPAISVTSPGPSEPTSSPATLEAGNDDRLTPVRPLPKTSLDQGQTSTKTVMPQPVPSPTPTFPNYNTPFRFSGKGTNVLETQRNFARREARNVPCHVHSRSIQAKKDSGKKVGGEVTDSTKSRRPREPPSFSSPWAASSCSPKRVVWKEVEDYNRQRKRVRFVGWAGIENPWETEGSSTACSEGSDCLDDIESPGPPKHSDNPSENQQTRVGEEKKNGDGKCELQSHDSVKVVITTAKDGTTTTVLEAGPNVKHGDGVEIVTKTLVRGDEVMTVTTTSLIPLVDMPSRSEAGD